MHLKSILSNVSQFSFFLILNVLLLNSLIVFTDKSYLSFFYLYNNEIFNFLYISFFFTLILLYLCKLKNYSLLDVNLIPFYCLIFYTLLKLTFNFSFEIIKQSLQISIIYLLYFFIKNIDISKLKKLIIISNIIVIYSIILKFHSSYFFSSNFFYFINLDFIGIETLKFIEANYDKYQSTNQFNYFNIILICIFFMNIMLKTYNNSIINLFTITFIFLCLAISANLYTKIILIFFILFYFINYNKLYITKLLSLFIILLTVTSPFYISSKYLDHFFVKTVKILSNPYNNQIVPKEKVCLSGTDLIYSNNSSNKDIICFNNNHFTYDLKSFRLRQNYQNAILYELYSSKYKLILGLDETQLKKLHSKGIFPHNSYLDIFVKHGLLGLFLFSFFTLYFIYKKHDKYLIIFSYPVFLLMMFDDYFIGNMFSASIIVWMTLYLSARIQENP